MVETRTPLVACLRKRSTSSIAGKRGRERGRGQATSTRRAHTDRYSCFLLSSAHPPRGGRFHRSLGLFDVLTLACYQWSARCMHSTPLYHRHAGGLGFRLARRPRFDFRGDFGVMLSPSKRTRAPPTRKNTRCVLPHAIRVEFVMLIHRTTKGVLRKICSKNKNHQRAASHNAG